MPRIKAGTVVVWESQSSGRSTVKKGVVLDFIPAWTRPWGRLPNGIKRTQIQGDYGTSKNPRYAVEVRRTHKKTGKELPPHYYMPLAAIVEKQNPQAMEEPNESAT